MYSLLFYKEYIEETMTCKNKQVKLLMKEIKRHNQKIAAAKSGMDAKTARKYSKTRKLPDELKKAHHWKTHQDVFYDIWLEIEELLTSSPGLQANTILDYLIKKYPERFRMKHLRTLQRRLKMWRAENGRSKEIMFSQHHIPGRQSQSDYTSMKDLQITIAGNPFPHLLYHFMLVYSRWEYVSICYSESFDSLTNGFEEAVWSLGGTAKEHRTDNLSAAITIKGDRAQFTENWQKVMNHYGVKPTTNNPGKGNENGSIEKSHDLFKKALDQQLMLRGSRDFENIDAYREFLDHVVKSRNKVRETVLLEELDVLHHLPDSKWYAPKIRPVKVSSSSLVYIESTPYSVPSRLIGYTLRAYIYPDKIQLYYGKKCLQEMYKSIDGEVIDYRHVIDSLVRKPGAFRDYKYKESLFPQVTFRQAYDCLIQAHPKKGEKLYLKILQLAKIHGEQQVTTALGLLMETGEVPLPEKIKALLDLPVSIPDVFILQSDLSIYDQLLISQRAN